MKRYIKHKFITFLFFGVLTLGHAMVQSGSGYSLEGYLKVRSLGKTAQDALQMYREIGATPQQVAIPYMILSCLGHPNYPGLLEGDNVCLFIFSSLRGMERKYIIMAKLQEESNLKRIVEGLGWGVETYKGWSFFARERDDFQVMGERDRMVECASANIKCDLEFKMKPSIVSLTVWNGDKDLGVVLGSLKDMVWCIDVPAEEIVIEGTFCHVQPQEKGDYLKAWLEKHGNRWGMTAKFLSQGPVESRVRINLARKEVGDFFNQLKASSQVF